VDGAAPGFGVAHEGVYAVHGAPPNTVYLLQRAIDINVNGVCTGTFITWPFPPTQPLGDPSGPPPARLTTSPSGAGAAHFTFEFAGGNPGLRVDIIFRLIEESPNPGGTELRTACGPKGVEEPWECARPSSTKPRPALSFGPGPQECRSLPFLRVWMGSTSADREATLAHLRVIRNAKSGALVSSVTLPP
jgi:hypothetical protein